MSNELQQVEQRIEFQKRVNSKLSARYLVSGQDAAAIDELLRTKGRLPVMGGNRRPVIVWGEIHQQTYQARVRNYGAKPVSQGQLFPSAAAASRHLAYLNHNEVKQAFCRAKQRGEDVAIVAGVPLRYADGICGIN